VGVGGVSGHVFGVGLGLVRRDTTARCVRIKKWVRAMPKGPMNALVP
jgi:hypothetical protein